MKNYLILKHSDYQQLALSIYIDTMETPRGVIVLLSDWPKLKSTVDPNSPFSKLMAKLTFTPFHERSLREKSEFLEEKLHAVEQANLEKGSFIMYKNELCSAPDLFINEYADRKELVSVNAISGKIHIKRIA